MSQPLLSVLIPAYNHAEGVERLLAGVCAMARGTAPNDVEVLVSDDSTDDAAAARIAAACATAPIANGVQYRRQHPPLGAVPNWNSLIDRAGGRYIWLLHHDEEPDQPDALADLLAKLHDDDGPDVWLLRCRVQRTPGAAPRLHFPPGWAAVLLRRWPGYLLRRNVIGPPSALWVRRRALVRYDEGLVWLVDVAAYVRMLARARQGIEAWPHGGILSRVRPGHSITSTLGHRTAAIAQAERQRIAHAQDDVAAAAGARVWLSASPWGQWAGALETALWGIWRAGWILWPGR